MLRTRYVRRFAQVVLAVGLVLGTRTVIVAGGQAAGGGSKPNILFIAIDDLNDWIGCMGGHPQTRTPNIDRFAADGVLFTNAHCPAPACNPSRTAIFTGRAPNRSGLYENRQPMREVLPDEILLPRYLQEHDYWSAGSGKMLHYFIDAKSWNEYFPPAETENPFPKTYYPKVRPVNLPRGGPWQYVETDWAALDVSDETFGGDWSVSRWIGVQLKKVHRQPFFLACGIYRPHEPWFVPKKYFEPFPLESVQLPPGYRADDLDDVPEAGVKLAKNRYFPHIRREKQWRQGVQGYLASIHFADAMVGRVLDALEAGPNADSTIVVLWSDHGWHLGEKEHWQKFTGWRAVTRVPLIVRIPPGISSMLPQGTSAGAVCEAPVSLLSLFPTLLELCGLPAKPSCDGPSLVPLLRRPEGNDWPHVATTFLSKPWSFSLSGRRYRYIRYADGGEEFYDIKTDPYEWTNLAHDGSKQDELRAIKAFVPTSFAQRKSPSIKSLTKLRLQSLDGKAFPASRPDGNPFQVYFSNRLREPVELCWSDREAQARPYGLIEPGKSRAQQTRPGAVWMVRHAETSEALGYFVVGDRSAEAIIADP